MKNVEIATYIVHFHLQIDFSFVIIKNCTTLVINNFELNIKELFSYSDLIIDRYYLKSI